jgi:AraC-like DNA-binding protein
MRRSQTEKTGSRLIGKGCLVRGDSLMTANMMANAEQCGGFRPMSDKRIAPQSGRADCANHQDASFILKAPDRVEISIMRIASAAGQSVAIEQSADRFGLLFLLEGAAQMIVDGQQVDLLPCRAVMIGRGTGQLDWKSNGLAVIVQALKVDMQICASAGFGGARRLTQRMLAINLEQAATLKSKLVDLAHGLEGGALGAALLQDLAASLVAQRGAAIAFPPSRSLSVARAHLDKSEAEPLILEALARKAGVTGITLQRGFKACFGMTVGSYAQAVRLHAARARLRSGWESRPIARIAIGSGFQSVKTFARAYQKLFGETPTQTRSEAFRNNNIEHIDST